MSSLDDIDSHELARSTGINLRYCETFRSVIRLFFWNDNQVLGYPVDGGTAIAALIPGYVCELCDVVSHVQISLFPPAEPAAASWTLVIAGSVKDGAALPDGADVVELEALHDELREHLRPVQDTCLSPAWDLSPARALAPSAACRPPPGGRKRGQASRPAPSQ
jgi:hypothetical protein